MRAILHQDDEILRDRFRVGSVLRAGVAVPVGVVVLISGELIRVLAELVIGVGLACLELGRDIIEVFSARLNRSRGT
jgi:hypothetical protein